MRYDSPPGLPEEYPVLGLAQSYAWSGQQLLSFEKVDDLFEALTSVAVKQVEAFTLWAQTVGLLLATHGALALAKARARERSEHLNRALVSNREIGHQPLASSPTSRPGSPGQPVLPLWVP